MIPTQDEQEYWLWPGFRFRIPVTELGPEDQRPTGLGFIRDKVGREKIAEIEFGLAEFAGSPLLNYTRGEKKWGGYCHPDLLNWLDVFWEHFRKKCGVLNMLPIVSGYRRVGTHVYGSGGRKGDRSGAGDFADDKRGHWKGLSVDMHWPFWAGDKGIIERYFNGDQDRFEDYLQTFNLWRPARRAYWERNHVSLLYMS
ncbi:MAG: hypothetical protein V3T41_07895 [bacterium]